MRVSEENGLLKVNAISGTYVVMLGFSMNPKDCKNLAGFAIERTDHTAKEKPRWMLGTKTFAATDDKGKIAGGYSTRHHPFQSFGWSDYSAIPGNKYTYRVVALKGPPDKLEEFAEASVKITTESHEAGDHDVYFNRGAGGSQGYARKFGNKRPDAVGDSAYEWLSRGLAEAILEFIGRAKNSAFGLRVAAYEFREMGVLNALREAADRGADVKIVYDHRGEKPGDENAKSIKKAKLTSFCTPRETNPSFISHNKFIVLLKNDKPVAVLTGGTNFSEGGIYGHSNVAHVVEEADVAAQFLWYWDLLQGDPANKDLAAALTAKLAIPTGKPKKGTTCIFSPRKTEDALDFYARLAMGAKDGLFMTFAFGMHNSFRDAYKQGSAKLRFTVMEKEVRPMEAGPAKDKDIAAIKALRQMPENRFAIGAHLTDDKFDRWLKESLTQLNANVKYVHNKFMLVDPLSDDPIVVAGSANFSKASSVNNDENMLVIRGNTRVADIYLGEFMRMYAHFAFRDFLRRLKSIDNLRNLETGDWWKGYFGDTPRSHQRAYFAQSFKYLT